MEVVVFAAGGAVRDVWAASWIRGRARRQDLRTAGAGRPPDRQEPDGATAEQRERIRVAEAVAGAPVQARRPSAVPGTALDGADAVTSLDLPPDGHRRPYGEVGRAKRAVRDRHHAPAGQPGRIRDLSGSGRVDRLSRAGPEVDAAVAGSPGPGRRLERAQDRGDRPQWPSPHSGTAVALAEGRGGRTGRAGQWSLKGRTGEEQCHHGHGGSVAAGAGPAPAPRRRLWITGRRARDSARRPFLP
jgi:hypothetical protein